MHVPHCLEGEGLKQPETECSRQHGARLRLNWFSLPSWYTDVLDDVDRDREHVVSPCWVPISAPPHRSGRRRARIALDAHPSLESAWSFCEEPRRRPRT